VIAVLIIIVLIYIQYRTKSKANKLLEAKSNEIEKQKDETEKLNTMLNEKNSDLEQAIVKIKKSESQLRQTNETKNKFFSIIAHDLKNPLTSLLSSTSLLARHFSALSEQEIKDYITRLNKSSRQMHELVDNLFQWAMSQVGKMEFLPEKTDLHDLISSVILSQKSSADYKNIAIENNINQECIAFVDGNMIRAVVRNLISNSIKFTEPGGTISISCRDDVKFQKIRICDTGIGIPPDKIDQIFMPDNKISTPGTMNEKGSGLGLMLCHEFIKRNGGIIKAENSKGQGACFTFTVPKSMI
jgi:signal transduction histidine kinase